MGLFENRNVINGKTQIPLWFMRQAGRYHKHYQNLKREYDFMTLCKNPELAKEVTLGPIEDFDFDAYLAVTSHSMIREAVLAEQNLELDQQC